MTINIATEECGCPVPMLIGWANGGWEGMAGGDVATVFALNCPEGYRVHSGPFKGNIWPTAGTETVAVNRNADGNCLIAEYKKK